MFFPAQYPGYVLDAAALLGIGTLSTDPLPQAAPGEVVLRIPDGVTLQRLRDSKIGNRLMYKNPRYDPYPFSRQAKPAGTYRLRIPVPGSQGKEFAEQRDMLPEGESVARSSSLWQPSSASNCKEATILFKMARHAALNRRPLTTTSNWPGTTSGSTSTTTVRKRIRK